MMVTKHNRELWPYEPKVMTENRMQELNKQRHEVNTLSETEARQMLNEPKIMPEDREETEQESAIFRLLAQEAPEPTSPLAWCVYGLCLMLFVLAGWHFVAWWLKGAPL